MSNSRHEPGLRREIPHRQDTCEACRISIASIQTDKMVKRAQDVLQELNAAGYSGANSPRRWDCFSFKRANGVILKHSPTQFQTWIQPEIYCTWNSQTINVLYLGDVKQIWFGVLEMCDHWKCIGHACFTGTDWYTGHTSFIWWSWTLKPHLFHSPSLNLTKRHTFTWTERGHASFTRADWEITPDRLIGHTSFTRADN